VRQQSFGDIWNTSPIVRALQDRENLKGECQQCSLRGQCGGCRAVAFSKTGDYLATDTRCWLGRIQSPPSTGERRCDYSPDPSRSVTGPTPATAEPEVFHACARRI
jgi:hypothetical protein